MRAAGRRAYRRLAMFDHHVNAVQPTAADIREQLAELRVERMVAVSEGVADIDAYIADLDEEIELWRSLFVVAAVTEIATLRAELSGAQAG